MNSSDYKVELNHLRKRVVFDCFKAIESIAHEIEQSFVNSSLITIVLPKGNPLLDTPLYISSCFVGEHSLKVEEISISKDVLQVKCHNEDVKTSWSAIVDDSTIQIRDIIKILELTERMTQLNNVCDFLVFDNETSIMTGGIIFYEH